MPFLNSSQQTPLKTQKVSLYIDWGFGLRQLLNLCPCQIWGCHDLDFLNFLIYRLATQLKNRIKVRRGAQKKH